MTFDPKKLRLPQDFSWLAGVKKELIEVPVRKPGKQQFVRVRSEEDYRLHAAVLEMKEERETYVVDPALIPALGHEATPVLLVTAIDRAGTVFLWPLRIPRDEGRFSRWARSAMTAAREAEDAWVRVQANMKLGGYDAYVAPGNLAEPEWPDTSFEKLLEIAFRDNFIDTLEHSVLKQLRGEI
ncbi:MAG: hypothetical protein H6707_14650 [Deltaproteobacteria bacterium]|nr:hypothetical protein [Deltaproteobacteria bacterium]